MKTVRVALLFCAVLIPFLASCDSVSQFLTIPRPTAQLTGVQFGTVTLESATLLFDVEIENPYTVDLPLTEMSYSLASGEKPLFEGQAKIAAAIPRKGKQTISLPTTVKYTDLIQALADLKAVRPGSTIPYKADLKLSADAPALGIVSLPMNRTGELTVPPMPKSSEWINIIDKAIRQ